MAVMKMDFSDVDGREYKTRWQNGENLAVITKVEALEKDNKGQEQLKIHFKNYFNDESTAMTWVTTWRPEWDKSHSRYTQGMATQHKIRREVLLKMLRFTGVFKADPKGEAEFDPVDMEGKVIGLNMMQPSNDRGDGVGRYQDKKTGEWRNSRPEIPQEPRGFFMPTEEQMNDHGLLKKVTPDWDKSKSKGTAKVDHQAPLNDLDDDIPF